MKNSNNIISTLVCSLLISCTNINPDFDHKKTSLSVTEQEVPETSNETNNSLPTSTDGSTTMDLIITTSVLPDTTTTEEISITGMKSTSSESSDTSGETSNTLSNTSESDTTGPIRIYCGNGIVELEEECDDGNRIDDDDCSLECVLSRTVFLTADYIGLVNFGGLAIADIYCQNDANKFNIPGKFKAWISDDHDMNDPIIRFDSLNFKGWYRSPLLKINNEKLPIAKGWKGLQEDLINPIMITSSGVVNIKTQKVWTNTTPDGKRNAGTPTCDEWTMFSDKTTQFGSPKETNDQWTAYSTTNCSEGSGGGKLYCFQVE